MAECPHGGDPNCCPPCQQPPAPRRVTRTRTAAPRAMKAEHPGICGECGFDIKVDDWITTLSRTTRGVAIRRVWVHASCADVEVPA